MCLHHHGLMGVMKSMCVIKSAESSLLAKFSSSILYPFNIYCLGYRKSVGVINSDESYLFTTRYV